MTEAKLVLGSVSANQLKEIKRLAGTCRRSETPPRAALAGSLLSLLPKDVSLTRLTKTRRPIFALRCQRHLGKWLFRLRFEPQPA